MSRAPVRRAAAPPAPVAPFCPENDCQRVQAEALTRLAEVGEKMHADFLELKPHLETFAEIGGKWLRFCLFMRKWGPRVLIWALPLAWGVIFKSGGEAADQALHALTTWLNMQTGGAS